MPAPSSRQMSNTPCLPGAWPASLQGHNDDTHYADVSSVSSYGSVIASARPREDSGCNKARRRWTYAGHTRSRSRSSDSASPVYANPLSGGANTEHDSKMSPLTETTISTAMSSPLNTPDMADWPTRLGGHSASQSVLLEDTAYPTMSLSSNTQHDKGLPSQDPSGPRARLLSTASRDNRFPSPHLDPPLLNFIPGLPPLRLPLSDFSYDHHESPPHPPSPPSEACSTPSSFIIPSLIQEHVLLVDPTLSVSAPSSPLAVEPSAHLAVSSRSQVSQVSHTDSPVLPTMGVGIDPGADYMRLAPPISDIDAFALAAAVASSTSRSSFSIPPSIRSSAVPYTTTAGVSGGSCGVSRPHVHSRASEAPAGRPSREATYSNDASEHPFRLPDYREHSRARRLSAPPPTIWHSPRLQTARTIRSRVDVGGASVTGRRDKQPRQPVLSKVKKLGGRIRGLFKSKGETSSSTRADSGHTASTYGLMTTTTAVTNVEYESEHPIPLPSPRARIMRNHRRSLPIQSLLPSSLDRVHSNILKRAVLERNGISDPPQLFPEENVNIQSEVLTSDPCRSPRTPKPRRDRTQTAPQTLERDKPPNERKARRFSLSSALTKSKIDALRSTVKPRPPLPAYTHRPRDEVHHPITTQDSADELISTSSAVAKRGEAVFAPPKESFWGGELPSTRDGSAGSVDSPLRSQKQMAQPRHPVVPSTPRDRRSRRFSMTSLMVKRSARPLDSTGGFAAENSSPTGVKKARRWSARRPRGDTVTATIHGVVRPSEGAPQLSLNVPTVANLPSNRSSLASSAESYYDASDRLSDLGHGVASCSGRSCSPPPESDLDSMSFARTPDHSSGTFSCRFSTEREFHHELSETAMFGSYSGRYHTASRLADPSTVSHLVGESAETPIMKTLQFSPSLTLSFDMSCSDFGDDDALHRMEREEDLSFMRALGFEFDEIARRVREEPL